MEPPVLRTERLTISLAAVEDAGAIVAYHRRNREHLGPWSPEAPEEFYTEEFWRERIRQSFDEFHCGRSARFFLREIGGMGDILGSISLSEVVRGPFQACYLGYAIDREREGEGLMREGLERVIAWGFDRWDLHRIMANYVPHNRRSGNLLRRLGFVVEGYARDYLKIAGRWEDHVLTSLTRPRRNGSRTTSTDRER